MCLDQERSLPSTSWIISLGIAKSLATLCFECNMNYVIGRCPIRGRNWQIWKLLIFSLISYFANILQFSWNWHQYFLYIQRYNFSCWCSYDFFSQWTTCLNQVDTIIHHKWTWSYKPTLGLVYFWFSVNTGVQFHYYTPRKLCLWWVYCFYVVRACVCACIRACVHPSVRP